MSGIRWALVATLCCTVACGASSSSPDSGPSGTPDSGPSGTPDSGPNGTPDSGTPDSGPADSGPADSGPADAGTMYGPESCSGIANCVTSAPSITAAVAIQCETYGTAAADTAFTALFECAQGCASDSDAGGCLDAVTADGGSCQSVWNACEAQGQSCSAIVTCVAGLGASGTQTQLESCIGEGTATAINLSENLIGCEQMFCTPGVDAGYLVPDGGDCTTSVAAQGGPCYSAAVACFTDTSGQ